MYIIYDFIFLIFALLYLPYFLIKGKFHREIWQRFGFFSDIQHPVSSIQHPIWLHAVSVGEVAAIQPLWKKLRQEFPLDKMVVSTVTKTGNELARRFANKDEIVLYLPLDISFIVRHVLEKVRPRALIIAETEIWPNLITACRGKDIPIILVNGRISNKAFRRYRLIRSGLRYILRKITIICAQTDEDRKRFVYLNAPLENVKVVGNMKYDIKDYTDAVANPEGVKQSKKDYADLKLKLGIENREKIFVAGSTHRGEEEIVLDVFKRLRQEFNNLHLIIAPRHVERANEIKGMIKDDLPVTVIDRIGVLQDLYSISDIVFVGGSLVRHGGHNIIEPAIFAKPILFGPHMFNFQDISCEFLKGGAAIMVKDGQALEINCRRLLCNEGERIRLGENARKVVLKNQGAARDCVYEIKRVLK